MQPRFLSILAPRIQQFLSWTVDTNSLSEPFLKKEDFPWYTQQFSNKILSVQQHLYTPPAYVASSPKYQAKAKFLQ